MRASVIAAIGVSILLLAAPARADDASRLGIARDIVAATHAADHLREMFPVLMQRMRPTLMQRPGVDAKTADAYLQGFERRVDSGANNFVDLLAGIYAREFSEDDLKAMLAFYRSPAGQHFVSKELVMTQALLTVTHEWAGMIAKDVLADVVRQKREGSPNL